ncbi:MAG: carbohydrate binding domain-containing protein [Verrucomicrobiae bacterium]|nr:carbohydrate binding domain-containing protein [Verrucomicrobiae bacterium]
MKHLTSLCVLLVCCRAGASELFPFVLPWDDATPSIANLAHTLDKPAGARGFVTARKGHLYTGNKRIRFFGVNICFGACFPEPSDAEKIAARMAKFGINCVRFHHMDTSVTPRGILKADKRTLDPAQLEKLKYFITQLKKNGIYANLNLHVGRTYPGMPTWDGMPHYYKGVDNFYPPMIQMQKDYARDLLTPFLDEPSIAFIEINNENALFREWFDGSLDNMPAPIASEFARQWNHWLQHRYQNDAGLRRAWQIKEQPLGAEMLAGSWKLEQHGGAKATLTSADSLRLDVTEVGRENWHIQFHKAPLAVEKGKTYTASFRARASAPCSISVGLSQAASPWRTLARTTVRLSRDWQTFTIAMTPEADEPNARFGFSGFASQKGQFEFTDISLKPGGILGLRPGETLGSVATFRKTEFATRTIEAQRDWIRFLWDTEQRYWTDMYRFIKDDLKARSLVIGTQIGYSPPHIQALLDVVDIHAYWQHPRFPGRPWDPNNWFIKNISMAAQPDGGTLPRLIAGRVPGKPYICSEYNHPAPNVFNSEAFLMLAATAAREDWDGIFAFTYSHSTDWDARKIRGYFDVDQHPTQMVTFPIASAMFRLGQVPASPTTIHFPSEAEMQEKIRTAGLRSAVEPPKWLHTNEVFTVIAPKAKAVIGYARGRSFELGNGVRITPRNEWSAIALAELAPRRWLLTATGYAENTDMGWKDPEKSTVGRNWGRAPSLVEGITATITLPRATRAWALDERGHRKTELPVRRGLIEIGPQYGTLWYELQTAR